MEKKTITVTAYKQGGQWIVSSYNPYYEANELNELPYWIKSKQDVRNYYKERNPEVMVRFRWA